MSTETAREQGTDASSAPFEPVLRPRVIERLRQAARRRITLVVAPAGFGKSVAIRQYLEVDGVEHLRFSVRKEHDSLVGFLRGLVVALEPIAPKASKSVAGAYEKASRGTTPVRDLAAWVAALLSRYEGTVVVDDLHSATGDETTNLLAEIIDRSSERVKWIISARTDSQLPSASWLAYGQRDDSLDQATLSLTLDEAYSACEHYKILTSRADLLRVLEITQAWPVAFSFAIRASANGTDLTGAALGSRETTYNYLADQVFNSLTDGQREFLLKTCMLPKLDARSLIAIDPDGQRRVDELRKSSSFLLPDGSDSFRYHDLFRDYLEHELRRRGDAVFRQTLIGAASKLVSSGSYDQGLTIYLTYRLTSHLDELLEKYGWLLLEAGSVDRVSSALNLIEKSVFAKSPILLSLQARIDDGAGVYDSADLLFERALALSWESEISALIAERWAVSLLNRFLIDRAHQVVHSVDLSRCTDVNISARLLGLMAAIEVRVGRVAEAERRLGEGLQRLPMISDGQTLALFLHYAAYVSLWLGRSIDARDYCLKALALSRELGLYDLGGRASSVLHEVSASRDDARGLSYSLKEMTRFGRLSGDPGLRQFALFSQYDAAVERGDVETAKALQAEVRAEMPVDEERWAQTVVAAEAMRLAIDGRFKEAYRLEAKYRLERCPPAARALRAAEIALYAACDDESPLAQVEADTAISLLRKASALDDVLSARLLKAMALTGLALLKQGRIDESKETLRATNISLNGGGSAGLLLGAVKCALALAAGAPVELKFEKTMESLASSRLGGYAALLEAVGVNPRFGAIALTTTEVKIMNLLRVGFSSKEIASRLGRSRFTVDTHVKTILRKLACNSRWEAVAKLAKRGFFETGPDG